MIPNQWHLVCMQTCLFVFIYINTSTRDSNKFIRIIIIISDQYKPVLRATKLTALSSVFTTCEKDPVWTLFNSSVNCMYVSTNKQSSGNGLAGKNCSNELFYFWGGECAKGVITKSVQRNDQ